MNDSNLYEFENKTKKVKKIKITESPNKKLINKPTELKTKINTNRNNSRSSSLKKKRFNISYSSDDFSRASNNNISISDKKSIINSDNSIITND